MNDMDRTGTFSVNIHAMSCSNRCGHCWVLGDKRKPNVETGQVMFILDKLAEMKAEIPNVGFFLFDEPGQHVGFLDIMEKAGELGLIGEEYFLPTNGSLLAAAPDKTWSRLIGAGCRCLQLTLYGLERTHDEFAGRAGAYRDVLATARRAMEFGIEWYVQIPIHPGNISELEETVEMARKLDPTGKSRVGWFPFLWQGRGRNALRVRGSQYSRLPANIREKRSYFLEEKAAIESIRSNPGLSGMKGSYSMCTVLTFQVERDLKVYWGGACDSGGIAAAVPELQNHFLLGVLGADGFLPLLNKYQQEKPHVLELLDTITWGELASRYGDPTNDEIFYFNDLPEHKWAAAYLMDELGQE